MASKVVVIGFDALDPTLARQWAASGDMPAFADLLERGAWGLVDNNPGLESGSAWATFVRGVTVDRHGQLDGLRLFNAETYAIERHEDGTPFGHRPIWRLLSDAGKRVAVIDVPYFHPETGLNGIQVSNWGLHDPIVDMRIEVATSPPELAEHIDRTYGPDPLGGEPCDVIAPSRRREIEDFRDGLVERVRRKTQMILDVHEQEPWDLLLANFSEAHCVGHQCWGLHDPTSPEHDPALAASIGSPMRDVYRALDGALAALLEAVDDGDTTVIVYSSHGMEASVTASILLDKILMRLDGFEIEDRTRGAWGLVRNAWKRLPSGARRRLGRLMRRIWPEGVGSALQGDRAARRFFEIFATNSTGGVRINLRGRESQGIVEPGEEYDRVLGDLQRDLAEIVNLDTGEALVARSYASRDVYGRGERFDHLPDLLVEWNKTPGARNVSRVRSPKIGTVEHRRPGPRTGDHGPTKGLFIAVGPGVRPGERPEPTSIIDFAPTIARLSGVEHDGFDGTPIDQIGA